jgi:hypothetical protein
MSELHTVLPTVRQSLATSQAGVVGNKSLKYGATIIQLNLQDPDGGPAGKPSEVICLNEFISS